MTRESHITTATPDVADLSTCIAITLRHTQRDGVRNDHPMAIFTPALIASITAPASRVSVSTLRFLADGRKISPYVLPADAARSCPAIMVSLASSPARSAV